MPDSFSRYEIYTSVGSIYCYKGTNVLRNRFQIRDNELLKTIEADYYSVRQAELLKKPVRGNLTPNHLCRIHEYFFGKLYTFAGHYRREDIMKGKTRFLPHQQIPEKLSVLLDLLHQENYLTDLTFEEYLARAAYFFAELNYIHPFREGNGRTTREFLRLLFLKAGYVVSWNNVDRDTLLEAMELSVYDSSVLVPILRQCIDPFPPKTTEQILADLSESRSQFAAGQSLNMEKALVSLGEEHASYDVTEPKTLDSMTKEELNAKLQHSYEQSLAGQGRPLNAVFDDLEKA